MSSEKENCGSEDISSFIKELNQCLSAVDKNVKTDENSKVIHSDHSLKIIINENVFLMGRDNNGFNFSVKDGIGCNIFSRTVCFNRGYCDSMESKVNSPEGEKTFIYIADHDGVNFFFSSLKSRLAK
jgi:hypothetical protein